MPVIEEMLGAPTEEMLGAPTEGMLGAPTEGMLGAPANSGHVLYRDCLDGGGVAQHIARRFEGSIRRETVHG